MIKIVPMAQHFAKHNDRCSACTERSRNISVRVRHELKYFRWDAGRYITGLYPRKAETSDRSSSKNWLTAQRVCMCCAIGQLCRTLRLWPMVQEAQLMLTNLRDAFGGQSRSPNIVPFHMLGIVSYCAIVTLSLRRAPFLIDFKNAVTLKTGLGVRQGRWKCHHVIEHIWLPVDVL